MSGMRSKGKMVAAIGSIIGVAISPAALAADQALAEKLAPEIAKACHRTSAGGDAGTIGAADLGRAIYASKVAPLISEYGWNRGGGSAIARTAFGEDQGDNKTALLLLRRLAETWTNTADAGARLNLPLVDGGVVHLIRARETLDDLWRGESLLP